MRTKRCEIIPEQCIACGLCALYAPDIFDYDEEGIVLFKQEKRPIINIFQMRRIHLYYKLTKNVQCEQFY